MDEGACLHSMLPFLGHPPELKGKGQRGLIVISCMYKMPHPRSVLPSFEQPAAPAQCCMQESAYALVHQQSTDFTCAACSQS